MFGIDFFHVRVLQVVLFCLAALAAYGTYKNRVFSFLAVYCAGIWLLVIKTFQYAGSGNLPMDISAICYFLYGICAILPVRPAKAAAAHLATLCGLIYGICMVALPEVFYVRDPSEFGRYFAIANHSLLFFGGLAMMGHVRFKKLDVIWTFIFLTVIVAYTEICIACGVSEGTAIFSQIVNGSIILFVAPGFSMPHWYYFAYYAFVAAVFTLWLALTYAVNRRAAPKNIKTGFFAA